MKAPKRSTPEERIKRMRAALLDCETHIHSEVILARDQGRLATARAAAHVLLHVWKALDMEIAPDAFERLTGADRLAPAREGEG